VKIIHIVLFGIGNVGSTLINQINSAKDVLKKQKGIDLQIPVITNSKLIFTSEEGVGTTWESSFEKFSVPFKIEDIIAYVKEHKFENLIAVDATASADFVKNYIPLLENGFHIVSANKIANTLPFQDYQELRNTLTKYQKTFLYETNVGAGLPVIETIRNLHVSGEKINRIRGVFSGSLSYIFNSFSTEDKTFSSILNKASELGLTEPDAREDLSGKDVARKLLILARELDFQSNFEDVKIHSLIPKQLNAKTTALQFKSRVHELDGHFQTIKDEQSTDTVLRYVGELDTDTKELEVKLIYETKTSSIGQLKGADAIFEIFTESYGEHPLVIQGAGAGKNVTARGLLSDIVKVSCQL
jgi:aspartokinase/homoserine dehydrogenase 1